MRAAATRLQGNRRSMTAPPRNTQTNTTPSSKFCLTSSALAAETPDSTQSSSTYGNAGARYRAWQTVATANITSGAAMISPLSWKAQRRGEDASAKDVQAAHPAAFSPATAPTAQADAATNAVAQSPAVRRTPKGPRC